MVIRVQRTQMLMRMEEKTLSTSVGNMIAIMCNIIVLLVISDYSIQTSPFSKNYSQNVWAKKLRGWNKYMNVVSFTATFEKSHYNTKMRSCVRIYQFEGLRHIRETLLPRYYSSDGNQNLVFIDFTRLIEYRTAVQIEWLFFNCIVQRLLYKIMILQYLYQSCLAILFFLLLIKHHGCMQYSWLEYCYVCACTTKSAFRLASY